MSNTGRLLLLLSPKGKRYLRSLDTERELHTQDGALDLNEAAEAGYGATVYTHLGRPYKVVRPTLYDLVKNVKRSTQIMYPKEIGYIIMRLGIGPGCTVIEAGSGSGGLTLSLAWFVGDEGRVHTFERRDEFSNLCGKNLARVGLTHRVTRHQRDISEGFLDSEGNPVPPADALFLDVRTPWDYIDQAAAAISPGAPVGFLLPTTNQVSQLLSRLEHAPFEDIEVVEILIRRYKPVAERLRPEDRMVAHTGFLVFARHNVGPVNPPSITRKKKDETEQDSSSGIDQASPLEDNTAEDMQDALLHEATDGVEKTDSE